MREIKFRGHSTKDNEWRYGFYVTDNITHEILTELENNEMYASQIDFISLGQCTGLKDKNGVEIYEGDIILTNSKKYKVWFSGVAFGLIENNGDFYEYICNLSHLSGKTFEVKGNIYENPELLESVK